MKNLQDSLKDTASSTTASGGAQGFRKILVAGELAMALVLLIGCGLMIRGFWKLQQVNTGINAENVITMKIALPGSNYSKGEQSDRFWRRLDEKIYQPSRRNLRGHRLRFASRPPAQHERHQNRGFRP